MAKELVKYELESPKEMTELANVVKDHVLKNNLYTVIQNKNYVQVDGWAFAGGQMGIYPRMKQVTNLSAGTERKWMAEVELVRFSDDKVVGHGFGLCSSVENKKKGFDEYAILSMAQTRATGKAFRNLIGWVMKLGENTQSFDSTPAEEMGVNFVPTVQLNEDTDGIQPELQQIQELMKEKGLNTTKQLLAVKKFAQTKGYKFDGWKMSSKMSRELLAALLAKKLSK